MNGLQLIATGGALPGRTVTNEELSRTVDTSDEWITTRTGIRARRRWSAVVFRRRILPAVSVLPFRHLTPPPVWPVRCSGR